MKNIIWILVILLTINQACAGDIQLFSVDEAVEKAGSFDTDLKILRGRVNIQQAQAARLYFPDDPELVFCSEGIDTKTHSGFDEQRITFSQGFRFPYKVHLQKFGFRQHIAAGNFQIQTEITEIESGIKLVLLDIYYRQSLIRLYQAELSEMENIDKSSREPTNDLPPQDRYFRELMLFELARGLQDSRKQLAQSAQYFKELTTISHDAVSTKLDFAQGLSFSDIYPELQEWRQLLQNYPALQKQHSQVKLAEINHKLQLAEVLPDFSISYYRQNCRHGYQDYGFEFGLSLPVWSLLTSGSRSDMARLEFEEAQLVIAEESQMCINEFEEAVSDFSQSREYLLQAQKFVSRCGQDSSQALFTMEQSGMQFKFKRRYLEELLDYYSNLVIIEKFTGLDFIF